MSCRWRLDQQSVLVTGGTRGIGRAIAEELASLGASVFLCARSESDVDAAVSSLKAKGANAYGWACDLADKQQRIELMNRVKIAFGGRLNHLINNVGTNKRLPTVEYTDADLHLMFATNFESAYHLSQLAHPLLASAAAAKTSAATAVAAGQGDDHGKEMTAATVTRAEPSLAAADEVSPVDGRSSGAEDTEVQPPLAHDTPHTLGSKSVSGPRQHPGNASIVFMSSVAGLVAIRSGSIYAATKGAMNQLTRNLACEWARDGIRVNAVAPWYISTDLANQVLANEEFRQEVISRTPARRVGEPIEVATAVAFFCLSAASFISGQVLAVDGAFSVNGFYPLTDS